MERMTGKGAASLMETYSKVYEEREPQAIDEGIMGALAKVGNVVAEEKTVNESMDKPSAFDQNRREMMRAKMEKLRKLTPEQRRKKYETLSPEQQAKVRAFREKRKERRQGSQSVSEGVDLFDVIKGHFIEEGLTEEEALAKMLDLTDEERTEIIEGSCGSKKKSKKKGGY